MITIDIKHALAHYEIKSSLGAQLNGVQIDVLLQKNTANLALLLVSPYDQLPPIKKKQKILEENGHPCKLIQISDWHKNKEALLKEIVEELGDE